MDALFKSSNAALKFAVNYKLNVGVERSGVSKMSDPYKGSGKGLVGMDGAAQAGMILSMVHSLGYFREQCLTARVAIHRIPCSCGSPCCSKSRPNVIWEAAIGGCASEVKRTIDTDKRDGTRGLKDDAMMRRAIVSKYFGERLKVKDIARAFDVTDVTVANHQQRMVRILKKVEGEAWNAIDDYLHQAGIVGDL